MKIMINCDGRGWAKHSRGASHKILIGFMEKIKIGLRENSLKAMQHVFVMLKWSNEIKTCFNCWLLLIRSISKIVEEFQCFSGISNLANIYLQLQPQSTLLLWRHAPNLWKYLLEGSGEYHNLITWQYYIIIFILTCYIYKANPCSNQDIYLHTQQLNKYPLQSPSREGGKAGHEVSTSAASQPWRWSAAGQNSCGAPAAAQQPAAAVAGGVAGQLAAAGTAGTGAQHLAAAAQHGINYAAQVGLRPSR